MLRRRTLRPTLVSKPPDDEESLSLTQSQSLLSNAVASSALWLRVRLLIGLVASSLSTYRPS